MPNTLRFILAFLLLGLINSGHAELVWAAQTVRTKLLPGGSFTAEFPYENRGKKPVQVLGVETDCGCVTVLAAPGKFIKPGEKGSLVAKMELEGRTGEQLKRIWVRTSENPAPGIELSIEVEVLEVFAFEPEKLELEWKQAGPTAAQTVTIRRTEKVPAEILAVESTSPLFDAVLDSSEAGQGVWQVRVAPFSTKEDNEGVVFVRSNFPLEHPRTYLILGRILPK